ncbi:uncharacterized protein LOC125674775 isoform X2 [Ostrea edulis]|uniref:uncharacterized protein LOC125674775 isoform X2 n=1 Tax=Ostrea edulis TaxID=37623 RepID=UPI00209559C4|nr:uncharacterized protein LOC125674775 isoform X2 [Ostrea edulis]
MYERFIFILLIQAELTVKNGIHGDGFCAISLQSMEYVGSCPSNKLEMEESSKIKNCSQYIHEDAKRNCSDYMKIKYHCVINEDGNRTIEVCAPERVINGFCAEFNKEGGRVIGNHYLECTGYSSPCPYSYKSSKTYLYQDCYNLTNNVKLIQDTKQGIQKPVREPTVTSSRTPQNPAIKPTITSMISRSTSTKSSIPDWVVTVISCSVIFVSILVLFVVLCVCKLPKKNRSGRNVNEDGEDTPFNGTGDQHHNATEGNS